MEKWLWGLLAGYTAELTTRLLAGKQCLCAREKTEQSNCSWETLWFSSSRHAAGFPPWDLPLQLMPLNRRDREPLRSSARTYWDRERPRISLSWEMISLIPSKSLWRRYAVKAYGLILDFPLEHTKVKERKWQLWYSLLLPTDCHIFAHWTLHSGDYTRIFLLSWLYRC